MSRFDALPTSCVNPRCSNGESAGAVPEKSTLIVTNLEYSRPTSSNPLTPLTGHVLLWNLNSPALGGRKHNACPACSLSLCSLLAHCGPPSPVLADVLADAIGGRNHNAGATTMPVLLTVFCPLPIHACDFSAAIFGRAQTQCLSCPRPAHVVLPTSLLPTSLA